MRQRPHDGAAGAARQSATRILVISPHPDDESVGCGGTIRKHVLRGDAVHVVFLTSGEAGGHGRSAEETVRLREAEARDAAHILGLTSVEFWHQPDGRLRATRQLVERLRDTITRLRPSLLFVPHDREMHRDHRAAFRLVSRALSAVRALRPTVLAYEVWTPLQDIDHVEDISEVMQDKVAAVRAYRTQCDAMRFDDAVLGLNRYRGEMHSWPGGPYAEIFQQPDRHPNTST
jgi:N-acetylglucosamine malate deacetylase 1